MKYTNKYNLPEGIYTAIASDDYSKGDADASVSAVIRPVQPYILFVRHINEIEVDVSDNIMALLGTAVHYILEKSMEKKAEKSYESKLYYVRKLLDAILESSDKSTQEEMRLQIVNILDIIDTKNGDEDMASRLLLEERIYGQVADFVISGKPDWYNRETCTIEDYKVTSVWHIVKGDYNDWINQLNTYAWLLEQAGLPVKALKVNAILRDWKKSERMRANYPQHQVAQIELPLMKPIDRVLYIANRIKLLQEALQTPSSNLPECTEDDRWHQPDKWAVQKPGSIRAVGVFDTESEAQLKRAEMSDPSAYQVIKRAGMDLKCEEYCNVKQFCHQYSRLHEVTLPDVEVNTPTQPIVIQPGVVISDTDDFENILNKLSK